MSQPKVKEDQLNDFKCSFCEMVMSVGPAYSNGSKNICGRCNLDTVTEGSTSDYKSSDMFDQLASNLKFPCTFYDKGCNKQTKWNENHEQVCSYRRIKCPMSYKKQFNLPSTCEGYSHGTSVVNHLEECHKENFQDPLLFTLSGKNKIFFTYIDGEACIVIALFTTDPDKYHISLLILDTKVEIEQYLFEFQILDKNKRKAIVFRQAPVESVHNIAVLFKDHTNMFEVTASSIEGLKVNFKNLDCKINIFLKGKQSDKIDEGIYYDLECPGCKDHMVNRIFMCTGGHSVCSTCNVQLESCPICRNPLKNTRNFLLEKLSTVFYSALYPCHNESLGCKFVSNRFLIREHKMTCKISGNKCILRCDWRGSSDDMVAHIRNAHPPSKVKTTDTVYTYNMNERADPYSAIFHDNEMFMFFIVHSSCQMQFALQHFRPLCSYNSKAIFKYRIEFIDVNRTGVKLCMAYLCQNLTQKPTAATEFISLTRAAFKPFCKKNKIQYKLSIHRTE